MTGFAKFTPLPLVELYVELQADEAEISQAYSYNILISTLPGRMRISWGTHKIRYPRTCLDGRLPLVRRYVRGTSPLPSPPALRRRTYCTSDAHNVCINPLVTRSSIMLDSITREKSHNPGGRTPP